MGLLSVNFDHTVMMRSDLSTFLPTLGLLGAVLKKIRLRTHKKHQKTQKIYSIDRWHCKFPEFRSGKSARTGNCTIVRVQNLHIALMNCVFLTVISIGPQMLAVLAV